jgi:ubiquitin carboxyl-terminal hydrolase 8
MDISKYDNKGRTGLVNLGNTCYINSFIQILNHTYELHDIFNNQTTKGIPLKELPDSSIFTEWNKLKDLMFSMNGIVSPSGFIQNLKSVAVKKDNELFSGHNQNDLVEFFHFIIDCMHNSISRSVVINVVGKDENDTDRMAVKCYNVIKDTYQKEYSEIMVLYYGMYVSVISSYPGDKVHSMKPEMYSTIELPIPTGATTIYNCFDEFVKPEIMSGDNAWFNEATGKKESVSKKMTFWNFPDIMIISLKRFSPCGRKKNNAFIQFPIESFDLSNYVSGYKSRGYVYDLFGVCNHMGEISHGHYTAFALNSTNEWTHFNDTKIQPLPDSKQVITSSAYCLFYRKK